MTTEERALPRGRDLFEQLLDGAPDAMVVVDAQGLIRLVNRQLEALFGYPRDELVGRPIEMLVPENAAQRHPQLRSQYVADPHIRPMGAGLEITARRKDGTEFPVDISLAPLQTEEGTLVSAAVRDITWRKRVEEALRKSESQLSLLYAHVSDVIFFLAVEPGERFRFVSVNPEFFKATGVTEAQVIGKLVQEIIPEPAHALVLSRYREAIREKTTIRWEEVSVYPTGTKHGEVAVTPVFDAGGRCTNLVGTVHDVTERVEAERRLRQLTAESEERARELARSNAELEQFAYVASHDLREPLRMVSGFTQLLARRYKGKLDEDADEFIQFIIDGASRMQELLSDLLAYSRVETRGKELVPTSVESVLEQVKTDLSLAISEASATVTHDELPTAIGDDVQLRQLFQNLIENAMKFRGVEPLRIHVGVEARDSEWLFSVRDNGIGFDPQYSDRIFTIFERLEGGDKKAGTGVGLAICKKIVERHGGRIWAESSPGEGSVFFFTLPRRQVEDIAL